MLSSHFCDETSWQSHSFIDGLKRDGNLDTGREVIGAQVTGIETSVQYLSVEVCKSASMYPPELVKYLTSFFGWSSRVGSREVFLPFTPVFDSEPNVSSFKINDVVFIKGPSEAVRRLILPADCRPPRVWPKVFREVLLVISTRAEYVTAVMAEDLWLKEGMKTRKYGIMLCWGIDVLYWR